MKMSVNAMIKRKQSLKEDVRVLVSLRDYINLHFNKDSEYSKEFCKNLCEYLSGEIHYIKNENKLDDYKYIMKNLNESIEIMYDEIDKYETLMSTEIEWDNKG